MKKRILFCGESSHIKSGFGNYTNEILSRLSKVPSYDVAELSCYRTPSIKKTESWKIYPAAVDRSHKLYQQFASNKSNVFGRWIFDYILLDFKPDIVIDIRDPWMFSYQESSPLRRFYHWILSPTYDSSPPKNDFLNLFANADTLSFHTNWAKEDYRRFSLCDKYTHIINDSVDTSTFKPIDHSKKYHKQIHGIDSNSFIIGSVMRNQKRKLIPDLFAILKNLLIRNNGSQQIYLYLHTTYPEVNGWDIPNLLLEYDVYHNVLFTYYCKLCEQYFVSKYKGFSSICQKCNNKNTIVSVTNGVSPQQMSQIYNLFDIYVQYSICEGFGIPQVEAASCGIPVITVDHGAMKEVGEKIGAKIVPIQTQFKELETGADRVYPDNKVCEKYIDEHIKLSKQEMGDIGIDTRKKLLDNYSWDITTKSIRAIIDNCKLTGDQGQWDAPSRNINKQTVQHNNSFRAIIYAIIDTTLKDPYLKKTTFVEQLLNNVNNGYVMSDAGMTPFNQNNGIQLLDGYINHAIMIEKIRMGIEKMPQEMTEIIQYD